ncbi:MAG: DUF58 domain-containing protein [Bacteroidetes bacterium]|nr:DUF58 domain-containing protein [Bacteroidota bacterium]
MSQSTTANDIFAKVRRIEIKTRGLSQQIFAGQYHSAFKGRGMAFSEVREYQYGDDVRNIDWNVTARFNHPFIKVFEEERELTVMLLIDVSGSNIFGSGKQLKRMLAAEIAAVLAFSAINNNDKVGVIFFSNQVEKFIPPKKGTSHILRIIREVISFEPMHSGTDLGEALRFLTSAIKKRSTAFLISDFIADNFEHALRIAARKHDLIALRVTDKRENELPDLGLVRFEDAETGQTHWVDTSTEEARRWYASWIAKKTELLNNTFSRNGVDNVVLYTDEDYVRPLMHLFRLRA